MSCKWCAQGECWGCKQNPQQGKGQKRGGNFGGPGGKRGNFGNGSDESMMAGMMMAMMAKMSGQGGGGGGGFRGGQDWKPKRQSTQSEKPWKGALQKALKADGKAAATYESEEVDKAARKWTATVTIEGEQAEGRGKGRSDAEHSAARNALRQLYPSEHAELADKETARKGAGCASTDPKARLHHGTQLFVRRQHERNMAPDDIKYEVAQNGGKLTATVTVPEGMEGPYVGQPNADKTKAEESAASAALEHCSDVFDELQRDATQKREVRQQERQAKLAEAEGAQAVAKKPMVGFTKGAVKREAVQKKPLKLSITLNR